MNKELDAILKQLQLEGYQPGTFQFEFLVQKRKVERCQELHNVSSCRACPYFDSCELAKNFLRIQAELRRRHDLEMVEREKKKKAFAEAQRNAAGVQRVPTIGIGSQQVPGAVGQGTSFSPDPFSLPGAPPLRSPSKSGDGDSVLPARPARQPAPDRGDADSGGRGSSPESPKQSPLPILGPDTPSES